MREIFVYNQPLSEGINNGEWRSLVARAVWDREVAGSNPVSPTTRYFVQIHHQIVWWI